MPRNSLLEALLLIVVTFFFFLFSGYGTQTAHADIPMFDGAGLPMNPEAEELMKNPPKKGQKRPIPILTVGFDDGRILEEILAEEAKTGKPQPSVPVAVMLGRSKEDISALIQSGSDINEVHSAFGTALHQAMFQGRDADIFAFLLQSGASPNLVSPFPGPPLDEALNKGREELAVLLLKAGADIKEKGVKKPETTAFHEAVSQGMLEAVPLMLEAGADPNEPQYDSKGRPTQPPIFLTASPQMLRLLFAAGAKANAQNQYGQNALAAISWTEANIPAILALLEGGVSGKHASVFKAQGETLIHLALRFDNHELFQAARKANISVKERDKEKVTPLLEAVVRGNPWFVRELLAAGAPIKGSATYPGQVFADEDSLHPGTDDLLAQAVRTGNLEVVQILLDAGVELNTRSNTYFQGTALHLAIEANRADIVEALLKAKAGPNVTDRYDRSALETAIQTNNPLIVEMLLTAGANPKVKNPDGATMLEIARAYERDPKIIALLEKQ